MEMLWRMDWEMNWNVTQHSHQEQVCVLDEERPIAFLNKYNLQLKCEFSCELQLYHSIKLNMTGAGGRGEMSKHLPTCVQKSPVHRKVWSQWDTMQPTTLSTSSHPDVAVVIPVQLLLLQFIVLFCSCSSAVAFFMGAIKKHASLCELNAINSHL